MKKSNDIGLNSIEISYILKVRKPDWDLGITMEELEALLSPFKRFWLRDWAQDNATNGWCWRHR